MRTHTLFPTLLLSLVALTANAFPPAPYYQIYGTVRDDQGNPLSTGQGTVILSGFYSAFGTASVSGGMISTTTLLNGGSGFTGAPTVTFSGGPGTGATGTAILTNGVVTGVAVTNPGSGYTAPVTFGITGGGSQPLEVIRSTTDSTIAPAINYSLSVPMDSGTNSQLYDVTAMRPSLPFTIRVVISGVNYVPMQIAAATTPYWTSQINGNNSPEISSTGNHWAIGLPAGKLRLDLWLGVDSNNDGLPDDWQWNVVNSDSTGELTDFTQIDPNGMGRNGLTYYQNYILGTYPLEPSDGMNFEIDSITNGIAKLHFQAITGRTYRISSSVDMEDWTPAEPFSLKTDASNPGTYHRAEAAKIQDIYVPMAEAPKKFFRLHVE
jgi:hypothetical protein